MGDSFQAWKQHFIDQARGLIPHQKNFYKVDEQRGKGSNESNIQLVTPSEQVVERAKATLSHPPTVYDPVTGIVQNPSPKQRKRKYVKKKKPIKKHPPKSKNKTKPRKPPTKKKSIKRKRKKSEDKWW